MVKPRRFCIKPAGFGLFLANTFISLPNHREPLHRQILVYLEFVTAVGHYARSQVAGGDQAGLRVAQLVLKAVYHAVNGRGGAEHGAGLHAVVGVGAYAALWRFKGDAGQKRCRARESLQRDRRARQYGSAQQTRAGVYDEDGRGGAEV